MSEPKNGVSEPRNGVREPVNGVSECSKARTAETSVLKMLKEALVRTALHFAIENSYDFGDGRESEKKRHRHGRRLDQL